MRKEVKPPAVRDPVETRLLKKAYHSIGITFLRNHNHHHHHHRRHDATYLPCHSTAIRPMFAAI